MSDRGTLTGNHPGTTPHGSLFSLDELHEALALGIAINSGDFELATGLIPQPVFQRLYDNGLLKLGSDHTGESYVIVTDAGEQRYAEILGGDVGDI